MSNWLSFYFEGNEDSVPDAVKTALTSWRLEILDTLKKEESIELPFYDNDTELDLSDEGDVVAWNIGFVDGMFADESSDWFADESIEDDVADFTLPMIVLSGIDEENEHEEANEELSTMRADEDLMVEFVNSIEGNLTELFLLFNTDTD